MNLVLVLSGRGLEPISKSQWEKSYEVNLIFSLVLPPQEHSIWLHIYIENS